LSTRLVESYDTCARWQLISHRMLTTLAYFVHRQ
jgi:hypothetical protein